MFLPRSMLARWLDALVGSVCRLLAPTQEDSTLFRGAAPSKVARFPARS